MELFSENIKLFTSIIGIYAIIWWSIEHFTSLFEFIINSIKPYIKCQCKRTLQSQYGQWAVVTGATDGIGKSYALELAKRGMNICLVSRTESKLVAVANEIEKTHKVLTKYIIADFSKGESIYENIDRQLKDIDIGILVNNVGVSNYIPERFEKISDEFLWEMINVNIGAVTFMSQIVIPKMKLNRRGLILNVSSGSQYQPQPLMAVYASTKSFVRSLSVALSKELRRYNVKVHLIIPSFVRTKALQNPMICKYGGNIFPDAETYVKGAIKTLGKCSHTSGYLYHMIQFTLNDLVPECIRIYISHMVFRNARQQYLNEQKAKESKKGE
ncbi:hydroxysteroid dehydrogenase-like protein 1 isoform X1 [Chironomus tepperi]|uniref:hydroxysteroid dehydrogenase-like protein 1 isoform X1 n=1 Tax=Chironomus tepperi TaxID=113505 RepID=UPI00391FB9C1